MKFKRHIEMIRLNKAALSTLIVLALITPIHAQLAPTWEEIHESLDAPISILLKGGHHQTGKVTQWDQKNLSIEVTSGGGIAELTFPASDIQSISFPGSQYRPTLYEWRAQPERAQDALALFRAYYQQQAAYLSLLSQQELNLFIDYADFALKQKEALKAVATIDSISPYIEDASIRKQLEENLLLAFFLSGMRDDAEAEARKWIQEAEPAGNSALGWRLLSEIHFEKEDYDSAFWTALYPIAFSNQMPMEHLDACYAFAILAADKLRLKEEAERLAKEMHHRGFKWPENIDSIQDLAPEYFIQASKEAESDQSKEADTGASESKATDQMPTQTPSPIDPVESLPTRIYN
jgi:hypothetical protein